MSWKWVTTRTHLDKGGDDVEALSAPLLGRKIRSDGRADREYEAADSWLKKKRWRLGAAGA